MYKVNVEIPDPTSLQSELDRINRRIDKEDKEICDICSSVIEEHFRNAGKEKFCQDLLKSCNPADLDVLASGTSSEPIKTLIKILQKHNNY